MKNKRLAVTALAALAATSLAASLHRDAVGPDGYRLALPGYRYEFPRDHFNHPDFQTEWWYYTGNLRAANGRPFGFELTFFRQGVRLRAEQPPWGVNDVYLAHLALSDLAGRKFYHTARLNRPGPGFAGADLASGRIWNGNWSSVWQLPPTVRGLFTEQHLSAAAPEFSLDLAADSRKPPVIHGVDGVSQKSAGLGHASHYISFTRLETRGSVVLGGVRYEVTGYSWMDHEFFTHQLEDTQTGWDWLSIQLDNGSELMLFRIRRKDGSIDPFSSGAYVDASGAARHLARDEFSLEPGRTWTSPATGARYPVAWTVRVVPLHLTLSATTTLDSQELAGAAAGTPSYWEGAIDLRGAVSGKGYLEMTGYDSAVKFGR